MGFGYDSRSFDFDFSKYPDNEVMFSIKVTQKEAPETIGAEIKFPVEFEADIPLTMPQPTAATP